MTCHRFTPGLTRGVALLAAVARLILGPAPDATAAPASDQLKPEIDRVVATLENPALKGERKSQERRQEIRSITDGIFDWTEMARRSLGRHWAGRTEVERREFVTLFRNLIERAYISKIEGYGGEKLAFVGEAVDGDQATVRTKIVTRQNQEVPIDYRMSRQGDRWRIYDVIIEGISLISNYRTQFDGIIRTSSYEELVKKIKMRSS